MAAIGWDKRPFVLMVHGGRWPPPSCAACCRGRHCRLPAYAMPGLRGVADGMFESLCSMCMPCQYRALPWPAPFAGFILGQYGMLYALENSGGLGWVPMPP